MKKNTLLWLCTILVTVLLLTACGGGTTKSGEVKSVTIAESLNASYQAVNPKTQFKSTDTIYVSVDVSGRPTSGTLNGKFYYGDQLISEATLDFSTVNQGVIFSIGEDTYAGLHLTPSQPWPVGTGYHFDLYINGTKIGNYPYEVIQ
jgi:hypothetical protein